MTDEEKATFRQECHQAMIGLMRARSVAAEHNYLNIGLFPFAVDDPEGRFLKLLEQVSTGERDFNMGDVRNFKYVARHEFPVDCPESWLQ